MMKKRPYAVIDLHCDTLTNDRHSDGKRENTLNEPDSHLALDKIPQDIHWAQLYAIFLPDTFRGEEAVQEYEYYKNSFYHQMTLFKDKAAACRSMTDMEAAFAASKTAAFLSVENGAALGGKTENLTKMAEDGVKAMTLVWNGENELASGHTTDHGLTALGREAVKKMEQLGILVDVSHLNDRGFYELLDIAEKPFAATHSNARDVCGHKRNLTGEMIREMIRRKCLVGLNYYKAFLEDDGKADSLESLYRHIDYFLAMGGEDLLALGSDFDGAVIPDCLSGPKAVAEAYEYFLKRGLSEQLLDKIYYQNAESFFRKMENVR